MPIAKRFVGLWYRYEFVASRVLERNFVVDSVLIPELHFLAARLNPPLFDGLN